jgi:hypothetical protein
MGIYSDQDIEYLSTETARNVTASERIRSVWPFLVRTVLHFHASLRGRRRINYDPEDILSHLNLLLLEKDQEWNPQRGLYFSFAYSLCSHELQRIHERANTVQAVHDSKGRAHQYEQDRQLGRLTTIKAVTLERLRHAMSPGTVEHRQETDLRTDDAAENAVERADHHDALLREIRSALADLPRTQAAALAAYYGFRTAKNGSSNGNGQSHRKTTGVGQMAAACGCSAREFHRRHTAALEAIRRRLLASNLLDPDEGREITEASQD